MFHTQSKTNCLCPVSDWARNPFGDAQGWNSENFYEETADKVITLAYVKLYLDYDMSKEFMPQFIKNTEFIVGLMNLMPTA